MIEMLSFLPQLPSFGMFVVYSIIMLSIYLLSGIGFGKDESK